MNSSSNLPRPALTRAQVLLFLAIAFLIVAVEVLIARAIVDKAQIVDFAHDASVDITSLANLRRDALHLQIQTDNFIRDSSSGFARLETERALVYNDLRAQAERASDNAVLQAKIDDIKSDLDLHDQLLHDFGAARLEEFPGIISLARQTMANANAKIDELYGGAEAGLFQSASDSLRSQRSSQIMLLIGGGLVMLVGAVLAISLHRSLRSHSMELAARTLAQEAERQRKEELETLFNIAGLLAQPDPFLVRCDRVLENMAEVVEADVAMLLTLDNQSQVLRLVTQVGPAPWGRIEENSLDSFAGSVLREGGPIAVHDYQPEDYPLLGDQLLGAASAAGVPIKIGVQDAPAALIVTSEKPGHFTPERMRLLSAVGDGLGILLDQAQLSQDLAANLEEMAGIDEVARIITSTLDIEEMFGTFAAEMKKLVPFDQAYLNLLDHESGEYTVRSLHDSDGPESILSFVRSDSEDPSTPINGIEPQDDSMDNHPSLDLRRGYSLAVPMTSKGQIVGSLELMSRHNATYGQRERVILERLARHIAPALENARLFERTRAEEVRATTTLYQLWAVLDAVDAGIVLTNDEHEMLWANRRFGEFFGSGEKDKISPGVLLTDPCVFSDIGNNVVNDPAYSGPVEAVKVAHPSSRTLDRFTAPVNDGRGNHIGRLWVYYDVSDRRRLEEQIMQAQKTETVGRLAGGVAHDFNNMLSVITINAEMATSALAKIESVNPSLPEYIEDINLAAERATTLTRQLLIFARRQELNPVVVDLDEQIAGLYKMLRQLIGEHIEFVVPTPPEQFVVKVDPGQFEQVLMNLAVNASDAMPDGGKFTIKTGSVVFDDKSKTRPPNLPAGEYVTVEAFDTGDGISKEIADHIFEPFFTTKESGKGTGLGLALCYGIVEQSNGHIQVESKPGEGTHFTIYLPRVRKEASVGQPVIENAPRPTGSETVLIVEDEPLVLTTAVRVLTEQGYTVLQASNGEEGLRVAKQHSRESIDLLLTDSVMPKMGGMELAQKLRVVRPDIKVLMTSGYADYASGSGSPDTGFAFITKPLSPDSLAHKVREVLEFQAV